MVAEILLGRVAALSQTHLAHVEPRAALLHQIQLHRQIQQVAQLADALAVHDVELGLPERGGHLVLHHLGAGAVADDLAAGLQRLDAAHIDANGGVELQRPATGGDLGVSVHDAHLLAELVDEDDDGVGLVDDAGELAQRLTHQAGVQAHEAVAHLTLDLGAGHQRGHGVHHHHVDGAGAHQRLRDLQCLLAGVGLGDEHILHIDAQRFGVGGIQRVLGIHEGHLAAHLLGLGQYMQSQRGLTGGLRPVDLHDTATGQTADTQCQIQRQRAGGDGLHIQGTLRAVAHDGALAIHLLDLLHSCFQRFFLVGHRRALGRRFFLRCHCSVLLCLLCLVCYQTRCPENRTAHSSVCRMPQTTRGMPLRSGSTSISPKPTARMMRSTSSACPMPTSKYSRPPGRSASRQPSQMAR